MSTTVDQKYLDPEESQSELLTHLDEQTRQEYEGYGNNRIEAAFQDRVFIVYQATGRDGKNVQRPPDFIAKLRILSFIARDENGCVMRLLNEEKNQIEEIGHVPKKIFGFPIFISIPQSFTLKWDAHEHFGRMQRTLSYVVYIKARNRADFFSRGNFYCETLNKMKELYRHLDLNIEL